MCDRITYCDVCECAECPKYGDDCDGDKRNDDLISRADAIEAVKDAYEMDEFYKVISEDIINVLSALPSAEAEPSLKAIKRQIDEHWYLDAPSVERGDAEVNEVKSPYMQQSPNRATHGRLIDADALMEELSDIQPYNWAESEAEIQEEADYSLFKSLINSAPTVQADRPHGEWLYRWNDVECSECGEFEKHKSNFCPNCGARMKGGDTE